MALSENKQKMLRGEMFIAFTPELIADRAQTRDACNKFNDSRDTSRRNRVQLWRAITRNPEPMPPVLPDPVADAEQFKDGWVEPPISMDYGYNVRVGPGAFVNFNTTFIDTCPITIGARTMCGPNCSFFSGTHPLDPAVRQGLEGPEYGVPIDIGEDCWLGGNVIVLPGVKIGRGSVVGAGSVVTKDVPAFHVVAGNPARILRKIETAMDPSQAPSTATADATQGAEKPMADLAKKLDR